jgi:hypothetical protein
VGGGGHPRGLRHWEVLGIERARENGDDAEGRGLGWKAESWGWEGGDYEPVGMVRRQPGHPSGRKERWCGGEGGSI